MGSWAVSSHVLCFLPFRYIKVLLPPIILTTSLSMCILSTLLWSTFHLQKPLSVPCIYFHPVLPLLHSSLLKKMAWHEQETCIIFCLSLSYFSIFLLFCVQVSSVGCISLAMPIQPTIIPEVKMRHWMDLASLFISLLFSAYPIKSGVVILNTNSLL